MENFNSNKKNLKSDELNIENRFIDETSILVFEQKVS